MHCAWSLLCNILDVLRQMVTAICLELLFLLLLELLLSPGCLLPASFGSSVWRRASPLCSSAFC